MACRSRQRAEDALKKLLKLFEDDVARFLLRSSRHEAEQRRVEKICENRIITVYLLDFVLVQSKLAFEDEIVCSIFIALICTVCALMCFCG